MMCIGEAAQNRTHQYQLLDQMRILDRKVDREFAAVGTADENRAVYFARAQQRCEILSFGIPRCRGRRAAIARAIVPDHVESLAERRPYVVPHSRMRDSVMKQNYRFRACTEFFVV